MWSAPGPRRPRLLALAALWPALASPAPNLLVNSSFETGPDARIAVGRWYVDGLPALDRDAGQRVHGRYSLRAPFSRIAYSPATTSGIEVRAAAGTAVRAGTDYSLSVWLRTDAPRRAELSVVDQPPDGRADPRPLATREAFIGPDWKRVVLRFRPRQGQPVYWRVTVAADRPGALWLDAVQLEAGAATDYAPGQPLEASLSAPVPGAIYTAGVPGDLRLRLANAGTAPLAAEGELQVADLAGNTVRRELLAEALDPGADRERSIGLARLPNGIYAARLLAGDGQLLAEQHFAVLPPPRPVARDDSAFGIAGTIAPEPLAVLGRLGFRWLVQMTVNGRMIYWDQVEPTPGSFRWYDDDVAAATSSGFGLMFNLEPCKTPRWAERLPLEQRRQRWADYVTAMARHYGDRVRYWTISDEVQEGTQAGDYRRDCWRDPAGYVPWHAAGAAALKAVDPGLQVILNASDDIVPPILAGLPPGAVDILADNSWHVPERFARLAGLARKEGYAATWAPGIAVMVPSWYAWYQGPKDEAGDPGLWVRRNRELTQALIRTLGLGAARFFQYTGTWVGNTDRYSIFEADGSLRPTGARFGALAALVDGLKAARPVQLAGAGAGREGYRLDRRDGVTVFALFTGDEAGQVAGIPWTGPLTGRDGWGNRLKIEGGAAGPRVVPVSADPVFLEVAAASADALESALARASWQRSGLPPGAQVQQAGRYAVLRQVRDGVYRPEPNVSLWYQSAAGWMEILRFRASIFPPEYQATPDGFRVRFDFTRSTEPFYLGPGQIPAELARPGSWLGSRRVAGQTQWATGKFGDDFGDSLLIFRPEPADAPGGAGKISKLSPKLSAEAPQLRLSSGGMVVDFATTTRGDPALFGDQPDTFGGWRVLVRPGDDIFLHQYYHAAPRPGPMQVEVAIRVRCAGGGDC